LLKYFVLLVQEFPESLSFQATRILNYTASAFFYFLTVALAEGWIPYIFFAGSIIANYFTEVSEIVLEQLESCAA
jgi:hypothetical protein